MEFAEKTASEICVRWKIPFARLRPGLEPAGSPERTLARAVVEDERGRLFRLEKINFLNVERKNEIARIRAVLSRSMPEVIAPLPLDGDVYVAEINDGFWQITPFIEGVPLDRPDYAGEGWRGPVLGDFLVRLRAAEALLPAEARGQAFCPGCFVRDLEEKIRSRDVDCHARLLPVFRHLQESLFPLEEALRPGFAHGDFHPLNVVWSRTGVRSVVDWEFCGMKPEMYDAALLVGCLGMEHPRFLNGDFVLGLLGFLKKNAPYSPESWAVFFDLVLSLRFAWLSDWFRRSDPEMIELETVYLGLLLENRDFFIRNWRLRA